MKELVNKRILIKLGGSVLEDKRVMKNLCIDIKNLKEAGAEIIRFAGLSGGPKPPWRLVGKRAAETCLRA